MKPNDLNTFVLHIYHTGLCNTHDLGISKMYKWTPDNRIFRVLKIGLISCSYFLVDNFFTYMHLTAAIMYVYQIHLIHLCNTNVKLDYQEYTTSIMHNCTTQQSSRGTQHLRLQHIEAVMK